MVVEGDLGWGLSTNQRRMREDGAQRAQTRWATVTFGVLLVNKVESIPPAGGNLWLFVQPNRTHLNPDRSEAHFELLKAGRGSGLVHPAGPMESDGQHI
jgi:hypothetical protein